MENEPRFTSSGRSNLKTRFDNIHGVWSHHHLELSGFNNKSHPSIVETKLLRRQFKLDAFFLAGLKSDPLKALQCFHRTGHAGGDIVDVELHDFVAWACAGIRDFNTNC